MHIGRRHSNCLYSGNGGPFNTQFTLSHGMKNHVGVLAREEAFSDISELRVANPETPRDCAKHSSNHSTLSGGHDRQSNGTYDWRGGDATSNPSTPTVNFSPQFTQLSCENRILYIGPRSRCILSALGQPAKSA